MRDVITVCTMPEQLIPIRPQIITLGEKHTKRPKQWFDVIFTKDLLGWIFTFDNYLALLPHQMFVLGMILRHACSFCPSTYPLVSPILYLAYIILWCLEPLFSFFILIFFIQMSLFKINYLNSQHCASKFDKCKIVLVYLFFYKS